MKLIFLMLLSLVFVTACTNQTPQLVLYKSVYPLGNTDVTYLGHASFMIQDGTDTIYLDPFVLPEEPELADFIFITNDHVDHCSPEQTQKITSPTDTIIVGTFDCVITLSGRTFSLDAGENEYIEFGGIRVESHYAYNEFNQKNASAGLLVKLKSGKVIYDAGDTGLIPEFSALPEIDLLLVPIGGKFTMNEEEAAEAAKIINPDVVIPMHYNSADYGIEGIDADPEKFKELLSDTNIEVIILTPLVKTALHLK